MPADAEFATRERIAETERLIRPHVRRTPVIDIDGAGLGLKGAVVTLKIEAAQHSGSFKARGAFANLLLRDIPSAGVAAASGGNHGAAVAFAARKLGARARIFVPEISSPAKIDRIRSLGADLVIGGARYQDAADACLAYAEKSGALNIHPYDAPETILGAASLGLEFESQAPDVDAILVAVGGGGLIAGVSAWYGDAAKIIAAEPEACPSFNRALAAGAPVPSPAGGYAGDSLGASRIGAISFAVARRHVAASLLVSDEAIRDAQEMLWSVARIVAEPGAATPFAALLSGAYKPARGEKIGVVISGANTTAVSFSQA